MRTGMKTQKWYKIPGFPGYEVSGDGKARKLKNGEYRLKTLTGKSLIGTYFSGEGERFYASWVRMYYCALHNINPLSLKGKNIFISQEDGVFKIETKDERIASLQGLRAYRDLPLELEEMKQRYKESKDLCDEILFYYETGDGCRLAKRIYGIKHEVLYYIYNSLRVYDPGKREEIFSHIVDIFFKTLEERKRIIYGLRPFFFKSARYIVFQSRKERRRKIGYSENARCICSSDY